MPKANQLADALARLGGVIRQLREYSKLSQSEFAKLCKLDQAQLSRIESGKVNVSVETLINIANASKMFLDINFSKS
jgi:transcriptional regulator with XRE-family HTH domain